MKNEELSGISPGVMSEEADRWLWAYAMDCLEEHEEDNLAWRIAASPMLSARLAEIRRALLVVSERRAAALVAAAPVPVGQSLATKLDEIAAWLLASTGRVPAVLGTVVASGGDLLTTVASRLLAPPPVTRGIQPLAATRGLPLALDISRPSPGPRVLEHSDGSTFAIHLHESGRFRVEVCSPGAPAGVPVKVLRVTQTGGRVEFTPTGIMARLDPRHCALLNDCPSGVLQFVVGENNYLMGLGEDHAGGAANLVR